MAARSPQLDEFLRASCHGTVPEQERALATMRPYLIRAIRTRLGRRLRTQFDSADIEQSVWGSFVRLMRDRPIFQRESAFTSLEQIAAYLSKMATGKIALRARRIRQELKLRSGQSPENLQACASTFGGAAAAPAEQLQALMSTLDGQARQLVELRLQGLSAEEIAERLKMSRSTVYRIIQRIGQKHSLHGEP